MPLTTDPKTGKTIPTEHEEWVEYTRTDGFIRRSTLCPDGVVMHFHNTPGRANLRFWLHDHLNDVPVDLPL